MTVPRYSALLTRPPRRPPPRGARRRARPRGSRCPATRPRTPCCRTAPRPRARSAAAQARERHPRMLVVDHANHGRRVDLVRAVERDAVLHRRLEPLQPVERVRERRRCRVDAAAGRLVVPRRPVRRPPGQQPRVRVEHGLVRRRLEGREHLLLLGRRILEQRQRPRRARRHDDTVERTRHVVVAARARRRPPCGAASAPALARWTLRAPRRSSSASTYARLPPRDRAPAIAPEARASRGCGRTRSRRRRETRARHRCGRPERRGHRHEVVPAERVGVALVAQEAVERLALRRPRRPPCAGIARSRAAARARRATGAGSTTRARSRTTSRTTSPTAGSRPRARGRAGSGSGSSPRCAR